MTQDILDLFKESEGEFLKALVYCEFDDRKGPVIYGQHPVVFKEPEDLKRIAQFSMPVGQFEDETGFFCFSLDEDTVGISCFLRVSPPVRLSSRSRTGTDHTSGAVVVPLVVLSSCESLRMLAACHSPGMEVGLGPQYLQCRFQVAYIVVGI